MLGLPRRLSGKESACNAGNKRDVSLSPGSGRSLGEGNGNSLQYSCLENLIDRGAWQSAVRGVTKSQIQLSTDWTGYVCVCIYIYIYIYTLDIYTYIWASLLAQLINNPPAMQETPVRFLGQEDPLEKG